jgi:hypothetical protein
MAGTSWVNTTTGERLEAHERADLWRLAHVVYSANVDLFEDEADALVALRAIRLPVLAS